MSNVTIGPWWDPPTRFGGEGVPGKYQHQPGLGGADRGVGTRSAEYLGDSRSTLGTFDENPRSAVGNRSPERPPSAAPVYQGAVAAILAAAILAAILAANHVDVPTTIRRRTDDAAGPEPITRANGSGGAVSTRLQVVPYE